MTDAPAPDPSPAPDPDDETEVPVVVAEPDASDGEVDRIELVRTGLVRLHIAGKRHTLRRPFFGELKRLRLRLEELTDEISDRSIEVTLWSQKARTELAALLDDTEADTETKIARRREIKTEDRQQGRALTDFAEQARLDWWIEAFEILGVNETPEDWPAWLVDPNLPAKVVQHWRAAPLARG